MGRLINPSRWSCCLSIKMLSVVSEWVTLKEQLCTLGSSLVLLSSGQLQLIYQLWLYNNNSWPHHLSLGVLQCILFVAASEDHSEASINRECSSPIVSWHLLLWGHYTCTGFLWVSGYSSRCPGYYLATKYLQDHHFQQELPFVRKEETVGNPPFLSDMEGGGFKRCFSPT